MTRWIYTMDGKPASYQEGENIYAEDGRRAFWVSEGWWHSVGDKARYHVDGDHVFDAGRAVFCFARG